jgi:DNA uptake protein ComE-like DNA-binding protein
MNLFKSHFWYHKSQRNGILLLVVIIIIFQVIYHFVDFSSDEIIETTSPETFALQKQIDSLKADEIEKRKTKVFPFNPNYLTDYKAQQLGMSIAEIDRLLAYRGRGKFINSVADFQKVTQVSDSLRNKIAPYFKFPDWVNHEQIQRPDQLPGVFSRKKRTTSDINLATAKDLQTIRGIGEKLSERIIKYRSRLQGYTTDDQLYEVWKIDKEVIDRLLAVFTVLTKPVIKKVNINTASFKEVLANPYINYALCKKIFEYRDQIAEFQNLSQLKKIPRFPLDKYERIVLYLLAE